MPGTHSAKFVRSSNQRAGITDAAQTGLDLSSTFTLEAWVKLTTTIGADDHYTIAGKYDNSDQRAYLWHLRETGASNFYNRCSVTGAGTGTFDSARHDNGGPFAAGSWNHLAVTYDISLSMPDSFRFYANGLLLTPLTTVYDESPTSIFNSNADFQIGANSYLGSNYSGNFQLDELRVWNVVRSQSQIQALMDSQAVGNESGLVACYHLDNDWTDATANGNDLTAVNSPTFVSGDVGTLDWPGVLDPPNEFYWSAVDQNHGGVLIEFGDVGDAPPAVTPVPIPSPLDTGEGGIVFGVRDTAARFSE